MELAARSGLSVEPAGKSAVRRFRRLVNDLGTDLYLAFLDRTDPVGLVQITYTRRLAAAPRAEIDLLLVEPLERTGEIRDLLVRFADTRARQRGCGVLQIRIPLAASQVPLPPDGFEPMDTGFVRILTTPAREL